MAMRLDDALARRMRIELEDRQRGAGVVEQVSSLMAGELGWSSATTNAEIEEYTRAVQRSLADEGLMQIASQSSAGQ
jgi:glycerol-3-phosphate dehydrogenase